MGGGGLVHAVSHCYPGRPASSLVDAGWLREGVPAVSQIFGFDSIESDPARAETFGALQ